MMADNSLFFTSFVAYFISSIFYIAYMIWGNRICVVTGRLIAGFGLIANTLALVARTMNAGHLPVASMYEFGMLLVWIIAVFFVALEWWLRWPALGTCLLLIAFLLNGTFLSFYQEAKPIIPALKSDWLLAHVVAAVIAYGALSVSFGAALLYFWYAKIDRKNHVAMMEKITILVDKSILFAMPFLTLLLVTGAIWAEYAWGSYWRWDPKETWSLITWIIYSLYLHGRMMGSWTANRAMGLAVAGFAAVLFTFLGVNVLLPGLHSYAR
jgi:cytochrome c-type biogenesis protein CcsB